MQALKSNQTADAMESPFRMHVEAPAPIAPGSVIDNGSPLMQGGLGDDNKRGAGSGPRPATSEKSLAQIYAVGRNQHRHSKTDAAKHDYGFERFDVNLGP
jgi:hypothetical protein